MHLIHTIQFTIILFTLGTQTQTTTDVDQHNEFYFRNFQPTEYYTVRTHFSYTLYYFRESGGDPSRPISTPQK